MHLKHCLMNSKGFTLVEVVLSLSIISLSIVLCTKTLPLMMKMSEKNYLAEDRISITQLRKMLVLGMKHEVVHKSVSYVYKQETFQIEFKDNRLVKTPGYEIVMTDLDDAYFYEKDDCIWYVGKKKSAERKNGHVLLCGIRVMCLSMAF